MDKLLRKNETHKNQNWAVMITKNNRYRVEGCEALAILLSRLQTGYKWAGLQDIFGKAAF